MLLACHVPTWLFPCRKKRSQIISRQSWSLEQMSTLKFLLLVLTQFSFLGKFGVHSFIYLIFFTFLCPPHPTFYRLVRWSQAGGTGRGPLCWPQFCLRFLYELKTTSRRLASCSMSMWFQVKRAWFSEMSRQVEASSFAFFPKIFDISSPKHGEQAIIFAQNKGQQKIEKLFHPSQKGEPCEAHTIFPHALIYAIMPYMFQVLGLPPPNPWSWYPPNPPVGGLGWPKEV